MSMELEKALAALPKSLTAPLVDAYQEALAKYRAGDWETVGLKAGKFCEIVYSILDGHVSGTFSAQPFKPPNMVDACKALEQHNKKYGRSICIQIPRILAAVYELRNNRSIGHVGSDVNPNHMDAEFFVRSIKWLIAELVRVFGKLGSDDARDLVEKLTNRTHHSVWDVGKTKRVLDPSMTKRDQVLLLLYASSGKASAVNLQTWSGYKNTSDFRNKLLGSLHAEALIDFDKDDLVVELLPPGTRYVEQKGLGGLA